MCSKLNFYPNDHYKKWIHVIYILIFLAVKKDWKIIVRSFTNSSNQSTYISKDISVSPTEVNKRIFVTRVVDAY